MQKLLKTYNTNPTINNAVKLLAYARKHPMAECLLAVEDLAILIAAQEQAGG